MVAFLSHTHVPFCLILLTKVALLYHPLLPFCPSFCACLDMSHPPCDGCLSVSSFSVFLCLCAHADRHMYMCLSVSSSSRWLPFCLTGLCLSVSLGFSDSSKTRWLPFCVSVPFCLILLAIVAFPSHPPVPVCFSVYAFLSHPDSNHDSCRTCGFYLHRLRGAKPYPSKQAL